MIAVKTYICVVSAAQDILLVGYSGHHVRPTYAQTWILRIVRNNLILQPEVCVHANDHHIQKSKLTSVTMTNDMKVYSKLTGVRQERSPNPPEGSYPDAGRTGIGLPALQPS